MFTACNFFNSQSATDACINKFHLTILQKQPMQSVPIKTKNVGIQVSSLHSGQNMTVVTIFFITS
jgi:hypothetical protein